ncbi:MAG TPA: endonuclease/exonuclease/phosphatase family protein [Thermoanaerobaculia bacterium]|nr:endonuclease/exonuclease/phosphatase family protein [Thermoanaerobaculia bacterium]
MKRGIPAVRSPRHRRAAAACALALFGLAAESRAQLFTLASQNALHLGWGQPAYQQNKETILKQLFNSLDVIVVQEVMAQANVANVTPGSHYFIVTPVQGPSSYREAYAFLVRSTIPVAPAGGYTISTIPGYARPPAGVLIGPGGTCNWVVDYHAVFGRSISVRRAEVAHTRQVYQGFQATVVNGHTCSRVVMAGDWNLGANDPTFQTLAVGWPIQVAPNVPTSLKRNGGPSEPYDHFLWDTSVLTINSPLVIPVPNPPGSTLGWRNQVSDHLGIACQVQ